MNVAEYIIKKIEELGVNNIFGQDNSLCANILSAINNNSQIDFISCTSSLNAGYAADGYARVNGYGALVTAYGTEELQAINSVAGAFAENIPIVCIVCFPAEENHPNKKLLAQNFSGDSSYIEVFRTVTSEAVFLTKDNAKIEIDRTFKTLARKKLPIYIGIPSDIANAEISDRYVATDWYSNKDVLTEVADKISEKINNSQKPVIIGDILVKRFNAEIEYREFVEKSKIPTTNFVMGTNLVDTEIPNYIGGYYANFKNPIAEEYVNSTDCLIAVGTIYSDINSFGCKISYDINQHIAIYGDYTYIEGVRYNDIKMSEVLDGVAKKLIQKNYEISKPNIGYKSKLKDDDTLTSEFLYSKLQEYYNDNDIIVAETIPSIIGTVQTKFPQNVNLLIQALWNSYGWGTPSVLGASVAKPQSRVILITNDYAHQKSALEIGTMLNNKLKPIIIVIKNNDTEKENGSNCIAQMNYSKLARAFEGDVWSTRVTSADDFDKALKVTQIMNKLCYIEVCLDDLNDEAIEKNQNNTSVETIQTTKKEDINIEQNVDKKDSLVYETIVHKNIGDENG